MARALTSQHCGPGSNPGVNAICGLSLLLVLSFAPSGFSPGTLAFPSPQKATFSNSNLTIYLLCDFFACSLMRYISFSL